MAKELQKYENRFLLLKKGSKYVKIFLQKVSKKCQRLMKYSSFLKFSISHVIYSDKNVLWLIDNLKM